MTTRARGLRRRRKPSPFARLRVFWVFIVLFVAAAAYGGYAFVTAPQLHVSAVDVQIDGHTVQTRDVLAAAHINRESNAWLLDTGAIARRVAAIPYVATAVVTRQLPAAVTIAVTEREPIACLNQGKHVVTIDAARRILETGCVNSALMKIAVRNVALGAPGTEAADAVVATLLADEQKLADAHLTVRSMGQDRFGDLVATDVTGVELRFGADTDLAQKASLVEPVRAATPRGRKLRIIDLRAPATPTVEFW